MNSGFKLYRNTKTGATKRLQTAPSMGQNCFWEEVDPEEVGVAAEPALHDANDDLSAGADNAEENSGAD